MLQENDFPLVSIRCTVFNHEHYLRQCLDGFIMQKTNFRFEVIVHDDASTDGSAKIIEEYTQKYPDIIKPIYQKVNQFSLKKGGVRKAIDAAISPKSKYIAQCEGDDYWTNPHKLQTQIDFLESHPDYALCFHNAINHWEDNSKPDSTIMTDGMTSREYSIEEIFQNWFYATASFVYRKEVLSSPAKKEFEKYNDIVGDVPLILSASTVGKIYGMIDIMSVYRRHNNGWSMKNDFNITVFKSDLIEATIIGNNLPKILKKRIEEKYIPQALNNAIFMHNAKGLKYIINNYPKYYWGACFKGLLLFIKSTLHSKFSKILHQ